MATLDGGINASQETIHVAGGSAAVPGRSYRIDDEVIFLRSLFRYHPTRWLVDRGTNGSTPASHSDGATIVAVNVEPVTTGSDLSVPSPFPGSSGGGSELLGPFTLTPSTSGLVDPADNGALLATIAAGSLVRAMPFNKTAWNGDTPVLYIVLSPSANAASSTIYGNGNLTEQPNGAAGGALKEVRLADTANASDAPTFGFAEVQCGVYAEVFMNSGSPSLGETDVYLLTVAV